MNKTSLVRSFVEVRQPILFRTSILARFNYCISNSAIAIKIRFLGFGVLNGNVNITICGRDND